MKKTKPGNLMNSEHKAASEASRKGFEATFGRRCEYHGGRPASLLHQGTWLCDECLGKLAIKFQRAGQVLPPPEK